MDVFGSGLVLVYSMLDILDALEHAAAGLPLEVEGAGRGGAGVNTLAAQSDLRKPMM